MYPREKVAPIVWNLERRYPLLRGRALRSAGLVIGQRVRQVSPSLFHVGSQNGKGRGYTVNSGHCNCPDVKHAKEGIQEGHMPRASDPPKIGSVFRCKHSIAASIVQQMERPGSPLQT